MLLIETPAPLLKPMVLAAPAWLIVLRTAAVDRDADQVAQVVAGGVGADEVADDEVPGRPLRR